MAVRTEREENTSLFSQHAVYAERPKNVFFVHLQVQEEGITLVREFVTFGFKIR